MGDDLREGGTIHIPACHSSICPPSQFLFDMEINALCHLRLNAAEACISIFDDVASPSIKP